MRVVKPGASEDALLSYRRQNRRRGTVIVLTAVLAACALIVDSLAGPSGLPAAEAIRAILMPQEASRSTSVIVWQVRLPVAVMALLVGGALALAGAEMQTTLRNPLAEPFTLGVSAAAALGAAVAIVFGIGLPFLPPQWSIAANAFLFSLCSLLLLQLLSSKRGGRTEIVILYGIGLGFAASALLSVIQFVASPDGLQQFVFWSMGSFSAVDWGHVALLDSVLALVLPFSFGASWNLTALKLGEERARSFGVNVVHTRRLALVRISLLSATAVSFVGIIGFVGLVGPHIARMMVGEDHRFFLPASALMGALVMSVASTVSKVLVPGVLLPIGLVTTLVGLPVFFWLIVRGGKPA